MSPRHPYQYRTPGGDIDLDRALGAALPHYARLIVEGMADPRPEAFAPDPEPAPDGVVRYGHGRPVHASSCGGLAVRPEFSWDVCAYYLLLGVRWTATRGEIRRAYVAACARPHGQEQEERLTYALAQLSDEGIRRAYDMTPLGGVFFQDRDVEASIRRAASAEAGRRMSEGDDITADEVMEEMGFTTVPRRSPREAPSRPARPSAPPWSSQWGYYAVSGPQGSVTPRGVLLEAWQGMVAAALREEGIVTDFAVAQGAEDSPVVLRDVNKSCIFVLTGKGASPGEAIVAVKMGISLGYVADKRTGDI